MRADTTVARLALAGDVMLGRGVNEVVAERGNAYPWGDLLPRLWGMDLFAINLECALTSVTQPWQPAKAFHFRADPERARVLRLGRVDFAALANNHIGDFGPAGLVETVEALDRAGIAHAGAGANLDAARRPAFLRARGYRVGILAWADHPSEWAAEADQPGINYTPVSLSPDDFPVVEAAIRQARPLADLLVFSIHWGPNMRDRPLPEFQAFARNVVDAGVDVFWGHSAHLVQGVEVRDRRLILYDTGDFLDDYAVDPAKRNDLSALFVVQFGLFGIERLDLVPVRIGDCRVNLATGRDRDWLLERIQDLCREFDTALLRTEDGLSLRLGPATVHTRQP